MALLAGAAVGAVAAVIALRRRAPAPLGERAPGAPDPRAEELRRKLAEAREAAAAEEEAADPETPTDAAVPERPTREDSPLTAAGTDDVAEARRRIHAEGRAAAEEMREEPKSDEPSA